MGRPKIPEWRILDYGPDFKASTIVSFSCPNCGRDAKLPVEGRSEGQLAGGQLAFGRGHRRIPASIQCRGCRMKFERGSNAAVKDHDDLDIAGDAPQIVHEQPATV
jgi:hypothetical protein